MSIIIILAWNLELPRIMEVSLTLRTVVVSLLLLMAIVDEFIQVRIIWINMHAIFLLKVKGFISDVGWRIFSNFASQL